MFTSKALHLGLLVFLAGYGLGAILFPIIGWWALIPSFLLGWTAGRILN